MVAFLTEVDGSGVARHLDHFAMWVLVPVHVRYFIPWSGGQIGFRYETRRYKYVDRVGDIVWYHRHGRRLH